MQKNLYHKIHMFVFLCLSVCLSVCLWVCLYPEYIVGVGDNKTVLKLLRRLPLSIYSRNSEE